jgi:hypothetical protein
LTVGRDEPVGGAAQTLVVVPVPDLAANIANGGREGKNTSSVLNFVSLEASCAESCSVVFAAEVADGNAQSVGVESPLGGALFADLFSPAPSLASGIAGPLRVGVGEETAAISDVVSSVAGDAVAGVVVGLALV